PRAVTERAVELREVAVMMSSRPTTLGKKLAYAVCDTTPADPTTTARTSRWTVLSRSRAKTTGTLPRATARTRSAAIRTIRLEGSPSTIEPTGRARTQALHVA